MDVLRIAPLAACLFLAAAPAARAQGSAGEVAGATGTIFRPIVLNKDSDLAFGVIVKPHAGSGTVVIDAVTGARSVVGQGGVISASSYGRASFTVEGEGGQAFAITVPDDMTMTRSGGSETITVDLTPSAVSGTLSSSLGDSGSATFGVGGEIPVSTATVAGDYAGSFLVTVAYN